MGEAVEAAREAGAGELNPNQRRSLSVGLQHIAGLLEEAEHALDAASRPSPFGRIGGVMRPADAGVLRDYLDRIRRALLAAARRHGLDVRGHVVDVRWAIETQAVAASISVEEMRPRRLRGFGPLDEETAREVDRTCDELDRAIRELQLFVSGGPEEDYAGRLARLGATVADPELLAALERVIREHGLVEFRSLLRSLLERLEERSFHVAVFGRVSSGKSSLLNALIGAEVLPVGVTPVTAVPTRVRVGSPASLEVRYATGASETLAIDALRSLASEEGNPGNVRRVARLTVVYPVPGLPEGVELVDTPGIGSLATSGAAEAFAYLPRTDLALLLVDVGSSIGTDEIGLLRLFKDTAVPFEVLLSKADLVGVEARAKLARYVRETVEREIGFTPEVSAVSAVEGERRLVQDFAEHRLAPRFAERQELVAASIRRLAGRLREGVVGTLRLRLGRPAGPSTAAGATERVRAADAEIASRRAAVEKLAELSEGTWDAALAGATATLFEAWQNGGPRSVDPAPAVRATVEEAARRLRDDVVAELGALGNALRDAALGIDPATAELVPAGMAPDLSGLPVLDAAAVVGPAPEIGRPVFMGLRRAWAATSVARALDRRYGRAVPAALRVYGYRLRDFGQRAASRMADSFHGAVSPFVAASDTGASPTGASDRGAIERDLAILEALDAKREETRPR